MRKLSILLIFLFGFVPSALAEDPGVRRISTRSESTPAWKKTISERTRRHCETRADDPRCDRYLAQQLRKNGLRSSCLEGTSCRDWEDAEERRYQEGLNRELAKFCRSNPDARRCESLQR